MNMQSPAPEPAAPGRTPSPETPALKTCDRNEKQETRKPETSQTSWILHRVIAAMLAGR